MTTAVIAVPSRALVDVDSHWGRLRQTWTHPLGKDVGEWEITNPAGGVFLRREGVRGLGMLKPIHQTDTSPAVAGALHRDLNYGPRDVFWPLQVFSDLGSAEYIARDRALRNTLRPDRESRWTVHLLDGSSRYLDLRFEDDGDWAPEFDPTFFGWTNYGFRFTANDPFWKTDAIRRSWRTVEPVTFYASSPAVLAISGSRSISTATITNPGDVPAYPKWTIYGPITSATVGIDGHLIEVPIALADGEYIVLDTAPTQQTAVDQDGNDRYTELGEIDWRGWVLPDMVTDLSIALDGDSGGKVELELQPNYLSAW